MPAAEYHEPAAAAAPITTTSWRRSKAEEEQKTECKTEGCKYTDCTLNWLKVVDTWSIAGWQNRFPRLYYVVGGLLIAFFLL